MKKFKIHSIIIVLLVSAVLVAAQFFQRPSIWLEVLIIAASLLMFWTFQMRKSKSLNYFEVHTGNKDPQIPLNDYKKSLQQSLKSLNYRLESQNRSDQGVTYIWLPPHWGHQLGGAVTVMEGVFIIEVSGPKQILKILQSHLGLTKIIY